MCFGIRREKHTSASAIAMYRSKGDTKDLADAVWEDAFDGTRNGKLDASLEGTSAPLVKVIPVPDAFTRDILESHVNYEYEESLPGVGIICLTQKVGSEDMEQTFIPFNDTAAGWCNKIWDCQFGGKGQSHEEKTAFLLDIVRITYPPPFPTPNLDKLYNIFPTSKFKI